MEKSPGGACKANMVCPAESSQAQWRRELTSAPLETWCKKTTHCRCPGCETYRRGICRKATRVPELAGGIGKWLLWKWECSEIKWCGQSAEGHCSTRFASMDFRTCELHPSKALTEEDTHQSLTWTCGLSAEQLLTLLELLCPLLLLQISDLKPVPSPH